MKLEVLMSPEERLVWIVVFIILGAIILAHGPRAKKLDGLMYLYFLEVFILLVLIYQYA